MVTPSPICALYHFTLRVGDIMCAATRAICTVDIIGTITRICHASRAAANWGNGSKLQLRRRTHYHTQAYRQRFHDLRVHLHMFQCKANLVASSGWDELLSMVHLIVHP